MFHLIIRLILVAFLANAGWRLGSEYLTHYRFREAVRELTLTQGVTADQLRRDVLDHAARLGVPLAEETLIVRVKDRHVVVSGVYVRPITFVPGYRYPWTFNWAVESYVPPTSQPPPAKPQARASPSAGEPLHELVVGVF
jgi:hypothetical protein